MHRRSRRFERELVRHLPDAAALVADCEKFGGGVVAREAHAVAFLEAAGEILADLRDAAGRGVAGTKRELPVGQVRVLEPLVRAGVNGEFRARADGRVFRGEEDLVRGGIGKFDLADVVLNGSVMTAWRARTICETSVLECDGRIVDRGVAVGQTLPVSPRLC